MGVEEDKQIDGAVAAIFAVVTLKLARLGGNGLANLADELGRLRLFLPESWTSDRVRLEIASGSYVCCPQREVGRG